MATDLLQKRLAELTFLKDEGVLFAEKVYTDVGLHVKLKEDTRKALGYFNKALKIDPNYVRGLTARACAYSCLLDYAEAQKDCEKLLEIVPNDMRAIAAKILVNYQGGEFEKSMVENLRLTKLRQKPDTFVLGVMKSQDAIENGVGIRAGHPLRDHFKIIRKMAWTRNIEQQKPLHLRKHKEYKSKDHQISTAKLVGHGDSKLKPGGRKESFSKRCSYTAYSLSGQASDNLGSISEEDTLKDSLTSIKEVLQYSMPSIHGFPFRPLQRYTKNIKNYMAERYLGKLFIEKRFLKEMMKQPGLLCPNKAGNTKIQYLVKSAYKCLDKNQETLRCRRPFYFIKYQESQVTNMKLETMHNEENKKLISICKRKAEVLLQKCRKAANTSNLQNMVDYAENVRVFCDGTDKKILPTRDSILQRLYVIVCDGYIHEKRFREGMSEDDKIIMVKVYMHCSLTKDPSKDVLFKRGMSYKQDYTKKITLYEKLIKQAKYEDQALWLYFEVARMYLLHKQYKMSEIYARKCKALAESSKYKKWQVNAMWLTAVNLNAQKNKNEARKELNKINHVARYFCIPELMEFLDKCIEVVAREQLDEIKSEHLIMRRQQNIIKLMPTVELKTEAEVFFKKTRYLPACRRMPVLPGTKGPVESRETEYSSSPRSRSPRSPRSSKTKDLLATPRRGIEFLELIQYHLDD